MNKIIEFIIQVTIIAGILMIGQCGDKVLNHIQKRVSTQTYDLICKVLSVYCATILLLLLVWLLVWIFKMATR